MGPLLSPDISLIHELAKSSQLILVMTAILWIQIMNIVPVRRPTSG